MSELINQSEFAKFCGVKHQAISQAVKRGNVVKNDDGLIDLDNKKNYQYLRKAGERVKKREKNRKEKEKEALKEKKNRRILAELAKKEANKNDIKEKANEETEIALSESDELEIKEKKSRIALVDVKTKYLYDDLIDKELIIKIFGEIENVIRKQGLTVGARSAPVIAAEFGRNTPEGRRFVQSVIDKEQRRFLDGLKRVCKKKLKNPKKK